MFMEATLVSMPKLAVSASGPDPSLEAYRSPRRMTTPSCRMRCCGRIAPYGSKYANNTYSGPESKQLGPTLGYLKPQGFIGLQNYQNRFEIGVNWADF